MRQLKLQSKWVQREVELAMAAPLELVDGAIQAGARAVNYVEATELIVENGEVTGAGCWITSAAKP